MAIVPRDRNDRLDSWKAIADYLGRDVRTLLRWEKEKGLPVRRVPGGKRQPVFAFARELDEWLVKSGESSSETGSARTEGNGRSESEFRAPATFQDEFEETPETRTIEPISSAVGVPRTPETGPRLVSMPRSREPAPPARLSAFRLRLYATATSILVLMAGVTVAWLLLRHPPKHAAALTQKRLTFNSSDNPIRFFAISPDGHYLAYSDPAGIHIKLISSGEERVVPRPAEVPADWRWQVAAWFPDGTHLVVNAAKDEVAQSAWLISVLGQPPRKFREGVWVWSVSPDGNHMVVTPELSVLNHQIWIMDSSGDNLRKVLDLENNDWYGRVRWSPDGQRLAFGRFRGITGNVHLSIETCDLEGANRTVVVDSNPTANGGLLWASDGRIVYGTNPSAGFDFSGLWQVGVDSHSGKPTGKPTLLTQWQNSPINDISGSADGTRLVLPRTEPQERIFLGELIAGGMRMNPPRRLVNDEANDIPAIWTPDSKSVLFVSNRDGPWGIFKQAINQEMAEAVVTRSLDISLPRLSADGAWILFLEGPKERIVPASTHRLMRVAVTGGAPQFLMETKAYVNFACAQASEGQCVILEEGQDDKLLWTLTAFDPIKGRGKILRTIEKGRSAHDFIKDPSTYDYSGALSPDGTTFAIARGGEPDLHIRLLALAGGPDREITVKSWPNISGLDWSPDGRSLFCGSRSQQGATLLRVDLSGSATILWQYKGALRIGGLPSPDGRYLAIFVFSLHDNLWIIENF